MFTKAELRQRIADNGGEWSPGDKLKFYEDENSVRVQCDGVEYGFLLSHHSTVDEFYMMHSFELNKLAEQMKVWKVIAKHLEIKLESDDGPLTVKSYAAEGSANRLQGMVEAYEKILIGREISASK